MVFQLVQTPVYLCPTLTWSVTAEISGAVLSPGCLLSHPVLPVITDIVHIAQSVSTTLTSAVPPPSDQLCHDVIFERVLMHCVWHSDLFAALFLWLPPLSIFFFFFPSNCWEIQYSVGSCCYKRAIVYLENGLFVQKGRVSTQKLTGLLSGAWETHLSFSGIDNDLLGWQNLFCQKWECLIYCSHVLYLNGYKNNKCIVKINLIRYLRNSLEIA